MTRGVNPKIIEIAVRRRRVAARYLRGDTQAEIAAQENVSQPTISNDLKAIREQWRQAAVRDFNEALSMELARIDEVEREAFSAWLRSCEDAESITQKLWQKGNEQDKDAVERKEVARTTRGQTGDPRFLTVVQGCIDQRCKLLGLYAPESLALAVGHFDVNEWREQRRARLQQVLELPSVSFDASADG